MCQLKDFSHLKLDASHLTDLTQELDMWHKYYLPIGETVVDIGAGNGETVQFYLNHGAKRVIAIESNAELLHENFDKNYRVIILPFFINSIKVDIEGSELGMIVETHNSSKFKKVSKNPYAIGNRNIWKIVRVKLAIRKRIVYLWRLFQ